VVITSILQNSKEFEALLDGPQRKKTLLFLKKKKAGRARKKDFF
jgi:hypothetical protein